MKLYICKTNIFTTVHSTRAKAVATLKKWNDGEVWDTPERTIKDSIRVVNIKDGGRLFYDDDVKSRGFITLVISKEDHNN